MGDVYGFAGGTTTDFIKLDVTNGTLTISGALTGGTIDIGGADASSFHVDIDGNMWLGAALLANASFKVTAAGAVTATSGQIAGWTLASSNLSASGMTLDASTPAIKMGDATDYLVGQGVFLGKSSSLCGYI